MNLRGGRTVNKAYTSRSQCSAAEEKPSYHYPAGCPALLKEQRQLPQ